MRALLVLLALICAPISADAQRPTGVSGLDLGGPRLSGTDLGSGRLDGISNGDLGSGRIASGDLGNGRIVDYQPASDAVLSDAQMAAVKSDRTLAALFDVTAANTVEASDGYTLYLSIDREGGCSSEAPCIVLIGEDGLYLPFASNGGFGGTPLGFLMPQRLTVSDDQAKDIQQGPLADHLRIDDGNATGTRGTALYSDARGDCTRGLCVVVLD